MSPARARWLPLIFAISGCDCGMPALPDAGEVDSGSMQPMDSGTTVVDSGVEADAGAGADAGDPADAGTDGGELDAGRWRWSNPLPQGHTLHDVLFASATLGWAVGEYGTLLEWDGSAWQVKPGAPQRQQLYEVWGSGPANVWAASESGRVYQWNGSTWTQRVAPGGAGSSVRGVTGSSANDVWVRFNSTANVSHWNGTSWTQSQTPNLREPTSVRSAGPGAVFVSTGTRGFFRLDDAGWTTFPNGGAAAGFDDVITFAGSDPWVSTGVSNPCFVRAHGGVIQCATRGAPGTRLSAASPTEIWSAQGTELSRFDGTDWSPQPRGTAQLLESVATASGGGPVFAVGERGAMVHLGTDGGFAPWSSGTVDDLEAVWMSSPTDGWAFRSSATAGQLIAFRYDGGTWTGEPLPVSFAATGVWGASASDVWAVGSANQAMHFDGTSWTVHPTDAGILFDVEGSGPGDIWGVGLNGAVAHWDGVSWTARSSGVVHDLYAVSVLSATDAWASGEQGTVLRWTGAGWMPSSPQTTQQLRGIWAASASAVFVGGTNGEAHRWNGVTWTRLTGIPAGTTINAVWGRSETEVYFVGRAGALYLWNGAQMVRADNPARFDLEDLHGLPSGEVFAVGDQGTILRKD